MPRTYLLWSFLLCAAAPWAAGHLVVGTAAPMSWMSSPKPPLLRQCYCCCCCCCHHRRRRQQGPAAEAAAAPRRARLLRRPPPRLARAALLCVRAGPGLAPPNPGSQTLEALRACSKRGRWKIALELLARLEAEASGEPLPAVAWHSALAACRKRERKEEALELLERMGAAADTLAHNEVLHTLRRTFDYDAAVLVWASLRAPDSSSASSCVPATTFIPALRRRLALFSIEKFWILR